MQPDVMPIIMPPIQLKISGKAEILDSFGTVKFTCGNRELINGTIVFDDFRIPLDATGGEY